MASDRVIALRRVARRCLALTIALLLVLLNSPARLQGAAGPLPDGSGIVTMAEAHSAAATWLQLVVERDGQWAGSTAPTLGTPATLHRGNMDVAYYVPVSPRGFIALSNLRDFPPIMAYSTESDLDPQDEWGMAQLLKDVGQARNAFALRTFGSLEATALSEIDASASAHNRRLWSRLLASDVEALSELSPTAPAQLGQAGPLLRTAWHQGPPFNYACPDENCEWSYGDPDQENALVGCVPLGVAQIMRYFAWPPSYMGQPYAWSRMLERYTWVNSQFEDGMGTLVTQDQIDAVADLCADAGAAMHTDYGCDETGAYMCNWYYADARDAFEDHFLYSDPGQDEPRCEDRSSYNLLTWWLLIVTEINHNRPMLYRIWGADNDFRHLIVVDGYRDTSGSYEVHANYGSRDDFYNAWYILDNFNCKGPCDWGSYEMVRRIYPRTGWCETAWGTFGPGGLPSYVYCDVVLGQTTLNGGTQLQFLPGTQITAGASTVTTIEGNATPGTRFYTEDVLSRGLRVGSGGRVKLYPAGSIRLH